MKRYQDYMDGITVSEALHRRLTGLTAPEKRPRPWGRIGAFAAALALAVGIGSYGLSQLPGQNPALSHPTEGGPAVSSPGGEAEAQGDLPVLQFVDMTKLNTIAADYSLAPPGALSREADGQDVAALLGGTEAMEGSLLWGSALEWSGVLWFLEDGAPCAASLWAEGDGMKLSLELLAGAEAPSCEVLPEDFYQTSQWQGTTVTALANVGTAFTEEGTPLKESREVSFYVDGVGYRLLVYADSPARAEELCARFVGYACAGGVALSPLSPEGAEAWNMEGSAGEPRYED